VVSTDKWEYNEETGCVCIHDTEPFHEYRVRKKNE
jgi:1,3-beta-galactosyl-N-acetylhexosamine phosphorylase